MFSSSSTKGSSGCSHPSRSSNTSSLECLGTSLILIAVSLSSHLVDETILTYPKELTKYKEHVIIKIVREFEVMPLCDIRAPKPTETILDACEGEMAFF